MTLREFGMNPNNAASTDSLPETAQAYWRDGYVACDSLLSMDEVDALRRETAAIVRGERDDIVGAEPGARDDDALMVGVIAVHFPHKISPVLRQAMSHPKIVEVLKAIIGPDIKSMQTMLFVKGAGQPGQAWHQDEHFIATRELSTMRRSRMAAFGCIQARRPRASSNRCARTAKRVSTPPTRSTTTLTSVKAACPCN
jgi:hypothetical protein